MYNMDAAAYFSHFDQDNMTSIYIAVPTHSEHICVATAQTLLSIKEEAPRRNMNVSVHFFSGSNIVDLRNRIVGRFLGSSADSLMMLDSDQGISSADFYSLVDRAFPVSGFFYPRRQYDWSRVPPGSADTVEDFLYQASSFVGAVDNEVEDGLQFRLCDRYVKAKYIGTGLMLVRRGALEALMSAFPDLEGSGFNSLIGDNTANWGFFNLVKDPSCNRMLSEDYSFCERWRSIGGVIWADVTSNTLHFGNALYQGSFLNYIRANYKAVPDPAGVISIPLRTS